MSVSTVAVVYWLVDNAVSCNLCRYARVQIFESNVMKYIIEWENLKLVEVRQLLCRLFTWQFYVLHQSF